MEVQVMKKHVRVIYERNGVREFKLSLELWLTSEWAPKIQISFKIDFRYFSKILIRKSGSCS